MSYKVKSYSPRVKTKSAVVKQSFWLGDNYYYYTDKKYHYYTNAKSGKTFRISAQDYLNKLNDYENRFMEERK